MTSIKQFSPIGATAEEIAAHIETTFRAENMNHLRKLELVSDLRFRLNGNGQLQYQVRKERSWSDDVSGVPLLTPEELAAFRAYGEAKLAWLLANPGDDLPADYVAKQIGWAVRELPACERLKQALEWVIEVDEYSPHYDPGEAPMPRTPTHEKISKKLTSAIEDVRRPLVEILTVDDVALLRELNGRTWRNKERFWVHHVTPRNAAGAQVYPFRLVDVSLSIPPKAGFLSADFERCIREARTLSEVKRICAIWRTPVIVRDVAGVGRVVLSEEKTEEGAHWLMIAPVEAKHTPGGYDAAIAAAWGK